MKKINYISVKKFVLYAKKIIHDIDNEIMFIKYRKVRDHCHFTGKYRGAVYSICNLNYKTKKKFQ